MGIVRAETIARMRGAFRKGLAASRFISDMKAIGLSYRRTDMLADWRSVNELEVKEGLLRYVRKDRYPTDRTMAAVSWELSKEYMYTVKIKGIIKPDEPVKEWFSNIISDIPMTSGMVEAEIEERWAKEEKYAGATLVGLQVWTAVHKVMV